MFQDSPLYTRLAAGEDIFIKCMILRGDILLQGDFLWARSGRQQDVLHSGIVKFIDAVHARYKPGCPYMIYSSSKNKSFEISWCDEVIIEEIDEVRYLKNVERQQKYLTVMSELQVRGHEYEVMLSETRFLRYENDLVKRKISEDFFNVTPASLQRYKENRRKLRTLLATMYNMVLSKMTE